MPVVVIEALQGAGKTWLCNKINLLDKVRCFDFDDIAIQAFNKAGRNTKKAAKKEDEMIRDIITKWSSKAIVVFVGLSLPIHHITQEPYLNYFLKIDDLSTTYRRFMLRETEKIARNRDHIERIIKRQNVKDILADIHALTQFIVCYMDYDVYKARYEEMLKNARRQDKVIKNQQGILKDIKEMARQL